jgi:hypothetical protein
MSGSPSISLAGFFTTGLDPADYDLPHPRIELPVILVIRRALLKAFQILRLNHFPLATAKEDEVTTALANVIENKLRLAGGVPGFDRYTFDRVIRHASTTTSDGTRIKKEPDLQFNLRADDGARIISTQFALFIEAKPVDRSHPAGSKYCDEGLQRFIDGEYAWAMQDVMMLGYARHGRSIERHLIPAMREVPRPSELATIQYPHPEAGTAAENAEPLHLSLHTRRIALSDNRTSEGSLWVYHSWHLAE